eukprot:10872438-Alexandrium_andersonii.AAC.1
MHSLGISGFSRFRAPDRTVLWTVGVPGRACCGSPTQLFAELSSASKIQPEDAAVPARPMGRVAPSLA